MGRIQRAPFWRVQRPGRNHRRGSLQRRRVQARSEAIEAAVAANRFTYYPGGETWANARLAGVTYDNLAEGQALAAPAKNANTFEQMRNFAVTQNGKVAAGKWIDVIRGPDQRGRQSALHRRGHPGHRERDPPSADARPGAGPDRARRN
ncbi:hypothetical protein G6F31_018144 [Rhizopus arrhizus]|nr:hypothetical protein G6F31_018144 [Rhizopus arrhizus]